jgi:hypothetical protein
MAIAGAHMAWDLAGHRLILAVGISIRFLDGAL